MENGSRIINLLVGKKCKVIDSALPLAADYLRDYSIGDIQTIKRLRLIAVEELDLVFTDAKPIICDGIVFYELKDRVFNKYRLTLNQVTMND